MSNKKKFAGYVRVSDVAGRSGPSFISPDVQREAIERLASANGLELSEVVTELDVSGARSVASRELGRLVEQVEDGRLGGLIAWRLSRLSRSLVDTVLVARRVDEAGGRLLCTDFDSQGAMAKPMLGLLAGLAEAELDQRRTGWAAARERAVARGVLPARAPFGYRRDETGVLVVEPGEAERVREAFRARLRGASLRKIADVLGSSATGAGKVIRNPVYIGTVRHGDAVLENAHEAILDRRTFELVQATHREAPARDGSLASVGVLAGFLRCAGCGFVLTVSSNSARIPSYSCRGRRKDSVCTARASGGVAKVDAYVWPMIEERAGTVDLEELMLELVDAQERFVAADRELSAFVEGVSVAEVGAEAYSLGVTSRREALRAAAATYREALDSQDAVSRDEGLEGQRELARRVLVSATLRKTASGRGRYEPIEDRLELVWRD